MTDPPLWVVGDLVDRGPDGVGVIDLLMRLQREAIGAGGRVEAVIGNHDIFLLAVCKFGDRFREGWLESGGVLTDLSRLNKAHVRCLNVDPGIYLGGPGFAYKVNV